MGFKAKAEKVHKAAPVQKKGTLDEKLKIAAAACAAVDAKFGTGSLYRFASATKIDVKVIPTGIHGVDVDVLKCGGVPRGRIIEIFGPESGGKTTLALQIIAEAQKLDGLAAFVDAEHAVDPKYARALNVDMDNLFFSQPDSGEEALDIVESLVRSGAFDVIVVDSVAALVPQAELDGEMGDSNVGLQARLMSQAMRKLRGIVNESGVCLIFINQIREKIGVMFGNPETTTGGRALRFYASVRLDVRRTGTNKEGDEAVSNTVKITAKKNKVGAPFGETLVEIEFGKGFNKIGSYVDAGIARGLVDKAGSWFSYEGERCGQGRSAAEEYFANAPEQYSKLKLQVEKTGVEG